MSELAYLGLFFSIYFVSGLKTIIKLALKVPVFKLYIAVLFTARVQITGGMPTRLNISGVSRHKNLNAVTEKVILKSSIQAWHNVTVSFLENIGDTEERILSTPCKRSWARAL